MKIVAAPIYFGVLHRNHNTSANKKIKKRKTNLEEDLLAVGTDVGRTRHHEDCGCSNLIWSSTKYRHNKTNAKQRNKESEP